MKTTRPRTTALVLLGLLLSALMLGSVGCDSDTTAPATDPQAAPVLPDASRLTFDMNFFDHGKTAGKAYSKDNFFNAYLRAVVVNVMTRIVITPPVAAFGVALHTPPSLQDDGSWIWVYTHVDGDDEQQIRLRGLLNGDTVEWELYVSDSAAAVPFENELWFAGTTGDDGDFGEWTFYDFNLEGDPAVATLEWGREMGGEYLILSCLHGEDAGDVLALHDNAPECSIDFTDGSDSSEWYIRWNEDDGTGSLMVPDYNDGLPACWDENQDDCDCAE